MCTEILSVGIDIGTTTTQIVFSKLYIENTSSYFSVPSVSIVDKKVVYKSEIYFTPFQSRTLLDGEGVKKIIEYEFGRAGFSPNDTQTGAVIITGESARKENANIVVEKLSGFAGDFVVSTAGPDLESIIAGKGSGAYQYSIDNNCTVANLDIGGGTTNIVLFDCGDVIAKGCLDIGGRLIKVNSDMKVEYISEKAMLIAQSLDMNIAEGKNTTVDDLRKITDRMSEILEQSLNINSSDKLLQVVQTQGSTPFVPLKTPRYLAFSGGVADYISKSESDIFKYGDIGVLLGKSILDSSLFTRAEIIDTGETIRATVVGAGSYTTSISGSTITYTEDLFPLKNIPVLCLNSSEEQECFRGKFEFLAGKIRWFLEQSSSEKLVLGLKGKVNPSFVEIKKLAECIADSFKSATNGTVPVIVVVESDMAKVLGQSIHKCFDYNREVVCLDNIKVTQGDYIDIGKPLMKGQVVPIVVKTLIFG